MDVNLLVFVVFALLAHRLIYMMAVIGVYIIPRNNIGLSIECGKEVVSFVFLYKEPIAIKNFGMMIGTLSGIAAQAWFFDYSLISFVVPYYPLIS